MEYIWRKRRRSIWKGAVAGAIGGLVASWAMNGFSAILKKATEGSSTDGQNQNASGNGQQQEEDPTAITAKKISATMAGVELNQEQEKKGGTVVHYAFGTMMGAFYGAAAEVVPPVKSLAGLPYGAALFVGADEIALPALGLSKSPTEYPLSRHLSGLGQHIVYGATVELVRRTVRDSW